MVQPNAPAEIYRLRILLLQINPPIWRRLHVPSNSSIAMLHDLLQIAFDWSDFHLHRFVIRGKEYGVRRMGCTTFTTDARKGLLSQFGFRVNERFLYEFYFGDLWQHQIRFEGIQPIREKKIYPVCVGGACASPPEDCGGPEAYMEKMDSPTPTKPADLNRHFWHGNQGDPTSKRPSRMLSPRSNPFLCRIRRRLVRGTLCSVRHKTEYGIAPVMPRAA
jgi:hypothetical protein